MDEHLVHQLPEPLPNVATHHPHWRESYFFIAHRPDSLGDVVILTLASYPQREVMDSLQMGRVVFEVDRWWINGTTHGVSAITAAARCGCGSR